MTQFLSYLCFIAAAIPKYGKKEIIIHNLRKGQESLDFYLKKDVNFVRV